MLQAILVWTGAVLALGLMLVMALGPVIVEVDSWWHERKHNRERAARRSESAAANAAAVAAVAAPRPARVAHPVA